MKDTAEYKSEKSRMNIYKKTKLEIIEFGDAPDDKFYFLVDLSVSPEGLNVEKLKLQDPRNFDQRLRESGCLMMFTGDEIAELISRGELQQDDMHKSMVDLGIKEGAIKAPKT